jgi:choline transport protein
MPSSGGVYHWATVTPGPRWGRPIGFFAGYWNWLAWIFGLASMCSITATTIVQMYALKHAELVVQPWQVFVVYTIVAWIGCFLVCAFNRFMPYLNQIGLFFIVAGFIVTFIVV